MNTMIVPNSVEKTMTSREIVGAGLTADRLRYLLNYDPQTGIFTRRVEWYGKPIGAVVGSDNGNGYIRIGIDGKSYYAHRLAWLYVYGCWPKFEIDHRDTNHSNNRISNLRDVKPVVNMQNIQRAYSSNKSTGVLGVSPSKKKFKAQINVDGKNIHIGTFNTIEEASSAYLNTKRAMHEGCSI